MKYKPLMYNIHINHPFDYFIYLPYKEFIGLDVDYVFLFLYFIDILFILYLYFIYIIYILFFIIIFVFYFHFFISFSSVFNVDVGDGGLCIRYYLHLIYYYFYIHIIPNVLLLFLYSLLFTFLSFNIASYYYYYYH